MLTKEQMYFQRSYAFWKADNRFKQECNNHWCKFYGGPMNEMWREVDDLSLNIHCPYPSKNINIFSLKFNPNDRVKIAVYKPFTENFRILEGDFIELVIGYVYSGCE